MALIKIYATADKHEELIGGIASATKLVAAAALNVPEMPTTPGGIETVFAEGLDLIGIDYIVEIVAVERPDQQVIAEQFIAGLNQVYPDKSFSVYFNNVSEVGMANTPRPNVTNAPITMQEAIIRSKDEI